MKTASQVLREAKALISDPTRWAQAGGENAFGAHCIATAIWKYEPVGHNNDRSLSFMRRALGGVPSIFNWNDAPERTHAEVMEAFDRAIALAEKDELPKLPRESDQDYTARVIGEIVATTPRTRVEVSDELRQE